MSGLSVGVVDVPAASAIMAENATCPKPTAACFSTERRDGNRLWTNMVTLL